MIKVTWSYTKEYSDEEFNKEFSDSNDCMYRGYALIKEDHDTADGVDDFNLEFTITHT